MAYESEDDGEGKYLECRGPVVNAGYLRKLLVEDLGYIPDIAQIITNFLCNCREPGCTIISRHFHYKNCQHCMTPGCPYSSAYGHHQCGDCLPPSRVRKCYIDGHKRCLCDMYHDHCGMCGGHYDIYGKCYNNRCKDVCQECNLTDSDIEVDSNDDSYGYSDSD